MNGAETERRETERLAQLLAPGVVLAAGVTYTMTAARGLIGGDSGELVAVAASGGVAHPPGYPLYTMWLRLTGWLPAESPAHRASLATAMLATLSVWALIWALRAWNVRPSVGALVATLYAFSPLAWRLGTEPEVFALNVAIAMFVIGLSSPHRTPRPFVLGLVAGLGLANHHSIVLLAPIGIWGVVRAGPRGVGRAVGGLAIGLLPYGTLLFAATTSACSWGDTSTLAGLVRHFLRSDYGTTQLSSVTGLTSTPTAQIAYLGKSVGAELAGLSVLGIFAFLDRRRKLPIALLVASFVLAGPVFVARFNLPPSGAWTSIVVRFHLLPTALACVLAGLGLEQIVALRPLRRERLIIAFAIPLGLVRGTLSFPEIKTRHEQTLDAWVANVALTAPARSIVMPASDHTAGALLYARCALGHDVVPIVPQLLFTDWHPRAVSRDLGLEVVRGKDGALDPGALLAQLASTDRAVFLEAFLDLDPRATIPPHYPLGPLLRVVGGASELPDDDALYEQNVALAEKFRPDPGRKAYARPWLVLANHFAATGDPRAEECRARFRAITVATGATQK